jgi:hypothetical protein
MEVSLDYEPMKRRWLDGRGIFVGILNVEHATSRDITSHLIDNSEGETPATTIEEVTLKRLKNRRYSRRRQGYCRDAQSLRRNYCSVNSSLISYKRYVWRTQRVPMEWKRSMLVPKQKKNDRKIPNNYRDIRSIANHTWIGSLTHTARSPQTVTDPQLLESQRSFGKGRRTVDQIWIPRQIRTHAVERANDYQSTASLGLVDLTKAYDSVHCTTLVAILRHYGVTHSLANIVADLYTGTTCRVRASGGLSDEFEVKSGVQQGCVLSPMLFNCYMITFHEKTQR